MPASASAALEALRVGPGVLAPANASALAHVDEECDVCVAQCVEEGVERPAVDADRRDRTHRVSMGEP